MVSHSSILAWRVPWTAEPGGLQSVWSESDTIHTNTSFHFMIGQCWGVSVTVDSLKRYRSFGIRSELVQILGCSLTVDWGKLFLQPHCPHRKSGNTVARVSVVVKSRSQRCPPHTALLDLLGGSDGRLSLRWRPGFGPWVGKVPGRRAWQRAPAWEIPWSEEPGGLWSVESPRVWHDQSCYH